MNERSSTIIIEEKQSAYKIPVANTPGVSIEHALSNHTIHTNVDNSTVLISEHKLREMIGKYGQSKKSRLSWL